MSAALCCLVAKGWPGPAQSAQYSQSPSPAQLVRGHDAQRQEVALEVEGRLFMPFFLCKSGLGWTIQTGSPAGVAA